MKNVFLTLLLLLSCQYSTSLTLKCPHKDSCLCLPGSEEFEFQCPQDLSEFIVHVSEKEILIDCVSELAKFNINVLPNITLNKIDKFRMRFCPLPDNGFKEIFDHFGLTHVKFLQFGSYNLSSILLTKDFFKGLEFLDSLQLNAVGIVDTEEDVFANTPNLTSLELQLNNIVLKKDIFKYTPLLSTLDLSENHLEQLPEGVFQHSQKLELFHLWSNSLTSIDDLTFQGLVNLKSLELSSNKIETISDGAFKSLINLSRINLSSNKLKSIPSDLFSHNSKLELVILKNNNLKIPEFLFSNLPALTEVDLTNCKMESIPAGVFKGSFKIKSIKLGRNKLSQLPEGLFQGLDYLEEIYLFNNKLEKLGTVFGSLPKLKTLHLQNNQIGEIGKNDLRDLKNLREIVLKLNKINKIHPLAFQTNNKLKKIDLSNNLYEEEYNFGQNLLENLVNLENVNLSHNRITQFEDVISMINKVNLMVLDLSYNQITNISIKDFPPISNKLTVNLEYNNITTVNFAFVDLMTQDIKDAYSIDAQQPQTELFLANNPLNCDCFNYELVRYSQDNVQPQVKVAYKIRTENLFCASPPQLEGLQLETLNQNLLVCPFEEIYEKESCPKDCQCFWRPHDNSVVFDCSNNNFTQFPDIDLSKIGLTFNQTEIHLEGNKLRVGPDQNLTGYENVTRLDLSNNRIERIKWLPPQLQILHLKNNKLKNFNYDVVRMLNTSVLSNLTLENNPWSCDCEATNFTSFLRQHTKVVDGRYLFCFNSTKRLIDLNDTDLCHQFQIAVVLIPILVILVVVALMVAVYCANQQTIKVWLYAHNLCLWWVTEDEVDKDKIYDAFISYSHRDEEFVVQNLLPVLEGGPNPYKLCLHYRNWVPGEFISTQVTNSVLESRRTLVVLSPNFLESVWGKMEFRTAHTQAMTEGRTRVIIVLYGDIEVDKLDEELKAYMKSNTYVKWGDPYFWNKLKYALPHSRGSPSNNNQKIANVMTCIDDKFNLVAPVTASPGTTPPVLSLDSNGGKKHPLNWTNDLETPPAESGTLLVTTGK